MCAQYGMLYSCTLLFSMCRRWSEVRFPNLTLLYFLCIQLLLVHQWCALFCFLSLKQWLVGWLIAFGKADSAPVLNGTRILNPNRRGKAYSTHRILWYGKTMNLTLIFPFVAVDAFFQGQLFFHVLLFYSCIWSICILLVRVIMPRGFVWSDPLKSCSATVSSIDDESCYYSLGG